MNTSKTLEIQHLFFLYLLLSSPCLSFPSLSYCGYFLSLWKTRFGLRPWTWPCSRLESSANLSMAREGETLNFANLKHVFFVGWKKKLIKYSGDKKKLDEYYNIWKMSIFFSRDNENFKIDLKFKRAKSIELLLIVDRFLRLRTHVLEVLNHTQQSSSLAWRI